MRFSHPSQSEAYHVCHSLVILTSPVLCDALSKSRVGTRAGPSEQDTSFFTNKSCRHTSRTPLSKTQFSSPQQVGPGDAAGVPGWGGAGCPALLPVPWAEPVSAGRPHGLHRGERLPPGVSGVQFSGWCSGCCRSAPTWPAAPHWRFDVG